MKTPHIMILGIGCTLYKDEGFGVHVIERLQQLYVFPDHISIVDGGVLGMNLLGVICEADVLIVVDAVRNKCKPGTLYRLEGDAIPERIRAKNSLHQVDFLEALTMCKALDKVPETVILGIEPEDIDTMCLDMSPDIQDQIEPMIDLVIEELRKLGVEDQLRKKG